MPTQDLTTYQRDIASAWNIARARDLLVEVCLLFEHEPKRLSAGTWHAMRAILNHLNIATEAELPSLQARIQGLFRDIGAQVASPLEEPLTSTQPPTPIETPSESPPPPPAGPGIETPALEMPRTIPGLQAEVLRLRAQIAEKDQKRTAILQGAREMIDEKDREIERLQAQVAANEGAPGTSQDDIGTAERNAEMARGERDALIRERDALLGGIEQERAKSQDLEASLKALQARIKADLEQSARSSHEAEQAETAQAQNQVFDDPEAALSYLRSQAGASAGRLGEFTAQLLLAADAVLSGPVAQAAQAGDVKALKRSLRLLDRIYEPAPPVTRLGMEAASGRATLHAIAVVQDHLHRMLGQMGVTPIDPARGDAFDPQRHHMAESDSHEWTTDPRFENCVFSVARIGFQFRGQTLRAAVVRRYGRLASPSAGSIPESAATPADPPTGDLASGNEIEKTSDMDFTPEAAGIAQTHDESEKTRVQEASPDASGGALEEH